jgi:hypothetical protein
LSIVYFDDAVFEVAAVAAAAAASGPELSFGWDAWAAEGPPARTPHQNRQPTLAYAAREWHAFLPVSDQLPGAYPIDLPRVDGTTHG